MSFSNSLVKRINPSFSLVVYLSLSFFFLQGGSQAVSNKFYSLAFLKYVVCNVCDVPGSNLGLETGYSDLVLASLKFGPLYPQKI
jgi:hypothetical protein